MTGAALLQPPKSSSWATLGAVCEVWPKLPPAFEGRDVDEDESPQAEKSVDMGMDGLLTGSAGLFFDTALLVGSDVAQASLEPQASAFEKPLKSFESEVGAVGAGFGSACDEAEGAERLNAELTLDVGIGADCFCAGIGAAGAGLGAGGEGSEKPNKSFDALVFAGLEGADGGLDAKLKSPKSYAALVDKLACGTREATIGFGAGLVPVSKNPPPLCGGEVNCGVAMVDRWLTLLLKFAKGSG